MELSELQQRVDAWIRQYGVRYFSELTNMTVLTEEVGSWHASWHANTATSRSRRGRNATSPMKWPMCYGYLVCLANQTGVDLTAAVEANFAKKTSRDKERHLHNPKL
jgi:hypothetical protein